MPTTVRISDETHDALRTLSQDMQEPMQRVLAKAVEAYRRGRILELSNEAYAAVRSDPAEWQRMLDERDVWDVALLDGLEGDEWPRDQ